MILVLTVVWCGCAKRSHKIAEEIKIPVAVLKVDPKVTIGKLSNGFRYVIRPNSKPENRSELRLVVDVGSVLENEDQQGLAHFVEHMAFNGTENFHKQESYLIYDNSNIDYPQYVCSYCPIGFHILQPQNIVNLEIPI